MAGGATACVNEGMDQPEEALVAKVVDRRRGGFCYEPAGAFGSCPRRPAAVS